MFFCACLSVYSLGDGGPYASQTWLVDVTCNLVDPRTCKFSFVRRSDVPKVKWGPVCVFFSSPIFSEMVGPMLLKFGGWDVTWFRE